MLIYLHYKLYNNPEILDALETKFGGIEVGTPDFAEDNEGCYSVAWSNDDSYDAVAYVHSISDYLERNYSDELAELWK